MSDHKQVFGQAWRDCLREHYKYVVRHDPGNRESVEKALIGGETPIFHTSDLQQFRIEATMRADDMPDDFVPDFDILTQDTPAHTPTVAQMEDIPLNPAHPLECQCPSCITINLIPHDDEGQPLNEEALAELKEELDTHKPDPDAPQQLTLF